MSMFSRLLKNLNNVRLITLEGKQANEVAHGLVNEALYQIDEQVWIEDFFNLFGIFYLLNKLYLLIGRNESL